MRTQIEERLRGLNQESQKGQETLTALNRTVAVTQQQVLRIDGAIQVLTELLEQNPGGPDVAQPPPVGSP